MMLFTLAAFAVETPAQVVTWRDGIDWSAAGDEVAGWLSGYLQVDTVNPVGNEMDGAQFLHRLADDEAIEHQIFDHGGNRASFLARIPGSGSEKPVCLLSHIDVVPSELENWTHDPLSGAIEDGKVWGRGALDMKGMTMVQWGAMVWLSRLQVPLTRDVILLAVADEEIGGMGMRTLIADHWDGIDCGVILNEGGIGIQDALFPGQDLHPISVAEKGNLWVRLVASGPAGHGSRIEPDEAPGRLLEAMERVAREYRSDLTIGPELVELLRRVGAHKGGIYGAVLRSKPLRNLLVKPKLKAIAGTRAVITDTLHLTGMGGASSVNVVPSEVWAQYDSRLRPDSSPEAQLAKLQKITAKLPGIRWEVIESKSGNGDSWDDPFFEAIAHYAVEERPQGVAGPVLSPGFTDSIFARDVGVRSFGYVPFVVTQTDAQRMHGHDEHVSVENLRDGTRVLFSLLADFATR